MPLQLDVDLSESQKKEMTAIPASSWFTEVVWNNIASPLHPNRRSLAVKNTMKQSLVCPWIADAVRGKRVLDLFSSNGGFSVIAALAGAREVVGVEYSRERVRCAEFLASTVPSDCRITFKQGDVYRIREYFDEPFDITLCLGGLYHIADPAFVLRQARELTTDRLIVQTARVLPLPGNWARFVSGSWHCSPGSIRNVLLYAGFRILEEQQPRWRERRRFPWYAAMCELCEPFALLMRE